MKKGLGVRLCQKVLTEITRRNQTTTIKRH